MPAARVYQNQDIPWPLAFAIGRNTWYCGFTYPPFGLRFAPTGILRNSKRESQKTQRNWRPK